MIFIYLILKLNNHLHNESGAKCTSRYKFLFVICFTVQISILLKYWRIFFWAFRQSHTYSTFGACKMILEIKIRICKYFALFRWLKIIWIRHAHIVKFYLTPEVTTSLYCRTFNISITINTIQTIFLNCIFLSFVQHHNDLTVCTKYQIWNN